jgi:hypothetical protein
MKTSKALPRGHLYSALSELRDDQTSQLISGQRLIVGW